MQSIVLAFSWNRAMFCHKESTVLWPNNRVLSEYFKPVNEIKDLLVNIITNRLFPSKAIQSKIESIQKCMERRRETLKKYSRDNERDLMQIVLDKMYVHRIYHGYYCRSNLWRYLWRPKNDNMGKRKYYQWRILRERTFPVHFFKS